LLALVCAVSAQTTANNPLSPPPIGGQASDPSTTARPTPPAPKEKSGLEKAIEEALKANPDLRVAAAKVHEAEATLSRARLQVTQKVVTAYQAVEIAKATVNIAQATLERLRNLQKSNAVSAEDVSKAVQELTAAKAKLTTAEADLNYLLGKSATMQFTGYLNATNATLGVIQRSNAARYGVAFVDVDNDGLLGFFPPANALITATRTKPAPIAAADKIRKALDRRVTIKFTDVPARDALKTILKEAEGLHVQASFKEPAWNEKITASLTDVPLGAVLQLLEDALGDYRTVVRGYGLLIAPRERVPAGAVSLAEFWQGGVKSDAPAANKPAAK
jgi:hypothetical protein